MSILFFNYFEQKKGFMLQFIQYFSAYSGLILPIDINVF